MANTAEINLLQTDPQLGEFIGNVIAGIYEGIQCGAENNKSLFTVAPGRAHQSWPAYFERLAGEASSLL